MTICKNKIIESVLESSGSLSVAARLAGCSLKTLYNRRAADPDIADAIASARESFACGMLDVAENRLLAAVENGEPWAIKYALSTKGKSRGYTERTEIAHTGEVKQIIMQMDIAE